MTKYLYSCPKCGLEFQTHMVAKNAIVWEHWQPGHSDARYCSINSVLLKKTPMYEGVRHNGAIIDGVVACATSTDADLGYNKGPADWNLQDAPCMVNLADAKDPNDPQGRSYREVNAARPHMIPVGWLVEMRDGVRVYVVAHQRNCDQTPLYTLAMDDHPYEAGGQIPTGMNHGWPESSLSPVQPGPRLWARIECEMFDGKRPEMSQERFEEMWLSHWPEIPEELRK